VNPTRENRERLAKIAGAVPLETPTTCHNLLKRHDLSADAVARYLPEAFGELTREEIEILHTRARYEGYIRRERERIERLRPFESRPIPDGLRYEEIAGLSREAAETCRRRRPRTLGEAARLPGLTPAAVAILSAHVARFGGAAPR
jgi:tRNA uridine 5-carboxymethylaminomethyl modification enzyme